METLRKIGAKMKAAFDYLVVLVAKYPKTALLCFVVGFIAVAWL